MKDYRISLLADYYGAVLPVRSLELLRKYYDEDMSLTEIADVFGISKQAVSEALSKAAAELMLYEQKLGLLQRHEEAVGAVTLAIDACLQQDTDTALAQLNALKQLV